MLHHYISIEKQVGVHQEDFSKQDLPLVPPTQAHCQSAATVAAVTMCGTYGLLLWFMFSVRNQLDAAASSCDSGMQVGGCVCTHSAFDTAAEASL
jgi:hypothetical protein